MARIIRYWSSLGVTGTTQVTAWANQAGASLNLVTNGSQYPELSDGIDLNDTGNLHPVVHGRDNIFASSMSTDTNLPDLSTGMTMLMVARQNVGSVCTDTYGTFVSGGGILVQRDNTANAIRANFGVNTPTWFTHPVANGEFFILVLRSDGVQQRMSVNGADEQVSNDVNTFFLSQKLSMFGQYPANKGFVHFDLYDEYLEGAALDTAYADLAHYLADAPTETAINLPALPLKAVGDADFAPGATSNSPAPMQYASNNSAVATIVSGNIHIVGPGTAEITAFQNAVSGYTADSVMRTLTVQDLAVITFPTISSKTTSDDDFDPGATANNGGTINYTSSNPAVATIVAGKVHIVGTGSTTITAYLTSAAGYKDATPVSRTLVVAGQTGTPPDNQSGSAAGYFFLDGKDMFLNWGVIVEMGEAEVLRYPPMKAPPEHDWLDSHGVETDLTTPRYNKRTVTLQCALIADNEEDFLLKRELFIQQFVKPGLHRLQFKTHPGRQYFVYYADTTAWSQTIPLTAGLYEGKIGQRFTLSIVEPDPSKSFIVPTAIVDDIGRIIIT